MVRLFLFGRPRKTGHLVPQGECHQLVPGGMKIEVGRAAWFLAICVEQRSRDDALWIVSAESGIHLCLSWRAVSKATLLGDAIAEQQTSAICCAKA